MNKLTLDECIKETEDAYNYYHGLYERVHGENEQAIKAGEKLYDFCDKKQQLENQYYERSVAYRSICEHLKELKEIKAGELNE